MASTPSLQGFERSISLNDLDTALEVRELVDKDLVISESATVPRFLRVTPSYSFVLPKFAGYVPDYRKFITSCLVDVGIYKDLESTRRLNWCDSVHSMVPILTIGDGNCLMHAASLAMWAINDRYHTLRKTVYEALLEDSQGFYHRRWKREQEELRLKFPGAFEMSEEQWVQEWDMVMKLVSQLEFPNGPQGAQYGSSEEIHIFVLANILRRTIIVVCDDTLRGNYGEPFAPVRFGGIYLPLHWDPADCVKSPLVIGYCQGHFTAVVSLEDGKLNLSMNGPDAAYSTGALHAVPLVKYDESPLTIHFLLPEEEKQTGGLLRQYLDCVKVSHQLCDSNKRETNILAARLQFEEPPECMKNLTRKYLTQAKVTYEHMLTQISLETSNPSMHQKHLSADPPDISHIPSVPCSTNGCEYFGSEETALYCSTCFSKQLKSVPQMTGCAAQNIQPLEMQQEHSNEQHWKEQCRSTHQQHQMQLAQQELPPSPLQQMSIIIPSKGTCTGSKQLQHSDQTNQQSKNCATKNCKYFAAMGTRNLCVRCYEAERMARETASSMMHTSSGSVPCANQVNGCTFYGHPEQHNLCSQCYSKFQIQMERNMGKHPFPQSGSPVSIPQLPMSNVCQSPGCPNYGITALYNRCVHCYSGCIKSFINCEGKSVTERPTSATLRNSGGRKGNLCATPGCLEERVPYLNNLCVECYETKVVRSSTAAFQANPPVSTAATPPLSIGFASVYTSATQGGSSESSVVQTVTNPSNWQVHIPMPSQEHVPIPQGNIQENAAKTANTDTQRDATVPQGSSPQEFHTLSQENQSVETWAHHNCSQASVPPQQPMSTARMSSSQSTGLTSSLLNAIVSGIFCTTAGCVNPVGKGTGNLCPKCYGGSAALSTTAPVTKSKATPKVHCQSPGCNQSALTETNNFCLTHFLVLQGPSPISLEQKPTNGDQGASRVPGITSALPAGRALTQPQITNSQVPQPVLVSSATMSTLAATPSSSTTIRCSTPGCNYYGIAANNFLCSGCYSQNMEEWRRLIISSHAEPAVRQHLQPVVTATQLEVRTGEEAHLPVGPKCAISGCLNQAVAHCNGLCDYCYQSAVRQELQQWPNGGQPQGPEAYTAMQMTFQSQGKTLPVSETAQSMAGLVPLHDIKPVLVPCMGKGCLKLDIPAKQGYCNSCSNKLLDRQGGLQLQLEALQITEQVSETNASVGQSHASAHVPTQVTPTQVLNVQPQVQGKCVQYGCTMYGSPELNGYCSKCFAEYLCTTHPQSLADQPHLSSAPNLRPQQELPPPQEVFTD